MYADYIVNHERTPGIGPLAGWRGVDGETFGHAASRTRISSNRYIANGSFWHHELLPISAITSMANRAYLEHRRELGLYRQPPSQIILQLYSEPLQNFRLAGARDMARSVQPPDRERKRIETYFDPLPIWYPPLEEASIDCTVIIRCTRITQRPMAHVPFVGLTERLASSDLSAKNSLFVHRKPLAEVSTLSTTIGSGSRAVNGRVKGQSGWSMGGEPHTVWTWNAIGKRRGHGSLKTTPPRAYAGLSPQSRDLRPAAADDQRPPLLELRPGDRARPPGSTCVSGSENAATARERPDFTAAAVQHICQLPPGIRRRCRKNRI